MREPGHVPRFGLYLGNYGPKGTLSAGRLKGLAEVADRAGWDSIWAADHVVIPSVINTQYPDRSRARPFRADDTEMAFEPLMTLTWLATHHPRLQVGTSILVLPQRNPLLVAKQIACLDVVTNGRVASIGVGAGWLLEEFMALGVDFSQRWGLLEEHLRVLKLAWVEKDVAFAGDHLSFDPVRCEPKPVQVGGPSLTVGGHSRRALRLAGEVADGWNIFAVDPATVRISLEQIATAAALVGRDRRPDAVVRLVMPAEEPPPDAGTPWVLSRDPDRAMAALDEYHRAGATDLVVALPETWSMSQCAEVAEWLSSEVLGSLGWLRGSAGA